MVVWTGEAYIHKFKMKSITYVIFVQECSVIWVQTWKTRWVGLYRIGVFEDDG